MLFSFQLSSEEAQESVLKDIREAEHSIEIELFIIDVDNVGLLLLDTLREKARQGVKVKLLVDSGGSLFLYLSHLDKELRNDGVEVSFFNHLIPWYPKNIRLWYFRDHRRSIIIDKKITYTGSVCFSNNMKGWRETMIRIEDPQAIIDMSEVFKRMWVFSEYGHLEKRIKPKSKEWLYLTNAPVPRRGYLSKAFIELIKNAQKEILLTTPYFVPDIKLMRHLKKAIKRGVRVSLLLPHSSDHPFVDRAGDFQKQELIKKGVQIYLYPKMIHSKTAVFDGEVGFVGSLNLDNISLHYNFEGGLIIRNIECVAKLRQHFIYDIVGLSPLTNTRWKNRPLKHRILASLIWPFRKLL